MEEEKKEVVEQPRERTEQSKSAMTAFILSMIGFVLSFAWLFSIAGAILGIISLAKGKNNNPETEQQPFRTFGRIAKPFGIIDIILGFGMFVLYLVLLILAIVGAVVAASEGALG